MSLRKRDYREDPPDCYIYSRHRARRTIIAVLGNFFLMRFVANVAGLIAESTFANIDSKYLHWLRISLTPINDNYGR